MGQCQSCTAIGFVQISERRTVANTFFFLGFFSSASSSDWASSDSCRKIEFYKVREKFLAKRMMAICVPIQAQASWQSFRRFSRQLSPPARLIQRHSPPQSALILLLLLASSAGVEVSWQLCWGRPWKWFL